MQGVKGYRKTTSRGLRLRCSLALVAFTTAWLAPLIHFAVVPHSACNEYGTLQHVSEHEHAAPESAPGSEEHADGPLAQSVTPDEHLGCQVTLMTASRVAPDVTSPVALDEVDTHLEPGAGDTHPVRQVAVYRWAPKTSPPIAC